MSSNRNLPASISKHHHPYFSPSQAAALSEKQRGKLSATNDERTRQHACAFIEAMSSRIGFPRRTTATAQSLYHRFHLFFSKKDYNFHEVALATLYVSAKMHDTLKKPQQLLSMSYAVRFPELAAKSKHPAGEVDVDTMDQQVVEHDRQRLISIERLILEAICFNFTSRQPFPYVIKIGRELRASKNLTKLAWRIAADAHRTLLPILFPPHTMALGSLYVAALLESLVPSSTGDGSLEPMLDLQPLSMHSSSSTEERTPAQIAAILGRRGEWEIKFRAQVEDLQEIAHTVLDLVIHFSQSVNALGSTNSSPHTPTSPSPHASRSTSQQVLAGNNDPSQPSSFRPALQASPDELLRLKIALREREYAPRKRYASNTFVSSEGGPSSKDSTIKDQEPQLGKNEGTVRFLFNPAGNT